MSDATLIDKFLQFKQHNQGRANGTCVKYRLYLSRLSLFFADRSLLNATREELESFVGIEAHKAGLSPRSRRAMVAAIRGFYAFLYREKVIDADPSMGIGYPSAGKKLPIAMSLASAEALLMAPDIETLKGVRDAAILALLIGSGLRVSGLCRLNQSHLLWMQDDDRRERLVLRALEKGGKERFIPMTTEAMLYIKAYLHHPELNDIDRTLPDGDQVLFVSFRNRQIPPQDYHGENRRIADRSIDDMIKFYGRKLKLPEAQLHAHAFRHLYGTELAESDVDLIKRMVLMGHADANTTAIYDHTAMRKLSKVVDAANPLRKIRTPVTELARHIERGKA